MALVEQPYRVAGRRSPAPAHQLDAAWIAVVATCEAARSKGLPLVTGGRSVRRARGLPDRGGDRRGRRAVPGLPAPSAGTPRATSRQDELDAVAVPVLVVQGESDPFGMPRGRAVSRTVVTVAGNHSLRSDIVAFRTAVGEWLAQVR